MPSFANSLFAANQSNHHYLFNQSEFSTKFSDKQSLILPIAHDSEWYNRALDQYLQHLPLDNRFHLSTQIKHIFDKPFCFFTEKAIEESGHDFLLPMKNDFVVCDYLKQFNIDSYVEYDESDIKLPTLDLYLYSFFGIVDITLLAKQDSVIYDVIKSGLASNNIRHDKRLSTDWNRPVSCPLIFNIADVDGKYHPYKLRLYFIDIGAIHGNKGYKAVCQNVGIDVSAKSLMDDYKSDMITGLKKHPNEYIRYANGDLNIYEILTAFNEIMRGIYHDLELDDFYIPPKLTIGATVADIASAAIFKWQQLPANDYHLVEKKKAKRKTILKDLMGLSSADYLRTQLVKSHKYLLGKIHGGRCHNNNPTTRFIEDTIADYDLAGAYSTIMSQLPFFTGTPWFYDGVDSEISLKEFLRRYERGFDAWHYTIYVSTNEQLDYEQDFLVSWLNASTSKQKLKNDNGDYSYIPIAEYKTGDCHIFKKEVVNCPVTSDTVKWIRSLSKQARNDLLDKLMVKSAIGYRRKDKGVKWQSINLGKMLISRLMDKRKMYKKRFADTKESVFYSIQEMFKLIINTVYGVMCSRHFITSNVVVANQITQAIRLGMYLMEKGLNLQGSITDGCMGSLNNVLYPNNKYKIYLDKLIDLYKHNKHEINKKHLRLGALDNAENIALSWFDKEPTLSIKYSDNPIEKIIEGGNNVRKWIDNKAWLHLRYLFPDFHYLLDFLKIETKDIFDSYIYQGAANYELKNPKETKYAMRGYSKKEGQAIAVEYDVESDKVVQLDDYDESSIPKVALSQLKNGVVKKLPAFIKPKILKSKDFVQHRYNERSKLICGDDVIEVGLPNYFSLSQYTYKTIEQYNKWKWAFSRLRQKYNESFEMFFTDDKGILHYDEMVKTLCLLVDSGNQHPIKSLSNKFIKNADNSKSVRALTKIKASQQRNEVTYTFKENSFDELVELID